MPVPDAAQLASFTTAVAENNHIATARQRLAGQAADDTARPCRGVPAIRRSSSTWSTSSRRTAPTIRSSATCRRATAIRRWCMFGERSRRTITSWPSEFVLLDNFYATGGNSGDGHQWATQANETAYAMWPGYVGRSYPFDGTDPIAYANTGFLWDLARARGKTVARVRRVCRPAAGERPEPARHAARAVAERRRLHAGMVDHGAARAAQRGAGEELPAVLAVDSRRGPRADLPEGFGGVGAGGNAEPDRSCSCRAITRAARRPTVDPTAMVADNDLALGQIVEALSNAPVLAEDGDPRRRRRRAERRRPRRRSPHHRARHLPLHPPRCASIRRSTRSRAWSRQSS